MSAADSVGSLLADIANLIADAIRILTVSDKRHWGPDEHEHKRALDAVLDEARKDFQELSPLLNGQQNYEFDRRHQSLEELRLMRRKFGYHVENLREWSKAGGAIDPVWTRHLHVLQKELHRTQCRAARRVYNSGQEYSTRCLGAYIVHRTQRARSRRGRGRDSEANKPGEGERTSEAAAIDDAERSRRYLAELVACNRVGSFQRFGEQDIAFVCDFCDGHIVWEDLDRMPNARTAQAAQSPPPRDSRAHSSPEWQATGQTRSTSEDKQVVFAPVAIANHCAPPLNEWQAKLLCPYCEVDAQQPQDQDDDEDAWKPEREFDDLEGLQEHLEWHHGGTTVGSTVAGGGAACLIM
ncbi:hypothetical protein NLU13_9376 [Sarocladium strictum]|uniref:Uncharacterized protein n=1 Tax=Sarocladium strictum TaxID=5046 RepID=A0AA39L4B0_SARSR|nr:hypothetical protein NLU13_9376 [Sarocladium strictum]